MIDWLEVARRELSPESGEVSEVFTGGEPGDLEKAGRVSAVFTVGRIRNPEKSGSWEMSVSWSPADAPVLEASDLENPSALEAATAKTAERGVFDVFAVGASQGLGVASGRESVGSTWSPPSGFQIFDDPPDEALRKPSKLIVEEGCPRNDEVLDGELRKPSKPLWGSEQLSSESGPAARWRRRFEDESIVVQRARDMPPEQARAEAFRHIVIEYLNETHPNTDPRVCAYCGGRDLPLTPTLPFGVGNRHAWLDQRCRDPWAERRRKAAIETMARLGVTEPAAQRCAANASGSIEGRQENG